LAPRERKTAVADGGLGLDPATTAEIIDHDGGGYLISTVYTKLSQRRALARAQRATPSLGTLRSLALPRSRWDAWRSHSHRSGRRDRPMPARNQG